MQPPETRSPTHSRWPWQRTLQNRLIITYGMVFLTILFLLMLYVGRVVYRVQLDQAEHALEIEAFLAANALEDPLSGYGVEFDEYERYEREIEDSAANEDERDHDDRDEDHDENARQTTTLSAPAALRLQQLSERYAKDTGARVSILTNAGDVIADSGFPPEIINNEWHQIEIQAAVMGTEQHAIRTDPQTGEVTLYAAAPISQGDRLLGIVRLAAPVSEIRAPIRRLLGNLIMAGLLALAVAAITSIGLARRIVRPVRSLEEAALAVSRGDFSRSVPVETDDELGALASAFNTMTIQLSRLIEQQRMFIASASHELRTPLTNIKLRTEALQAMELTEHATGQRYLLEIDREADRLGRMANVLLDLSRLEATHSVLPGEKVDIAPILLEQVRSMQMRLRDASLTLSVDLPERLPPLRVWPHDIEEIVSNLLDNAIKYTPGGGTIQLTAKHIDSHCRVEVCDTGIGIPEAELPFIFDRFYRVDKARSRKAEPTETGSGAGLGLAIVKTLVEQNDGRISAVARDDGTCFVVDFPVSIT